MKKKHATERCWEEEKNPHYNKNSFILSSSLSALWIWSQSKDLPGKPTGNPHGHSENMQDSIQIVTQFQRLTRGPWRREVAIPPVVPK